MTVNKEEIMRQIFLHPHASDRSIAKQSHCSQPTVTRMRHDMQRTALFKYAVIPDLAQLGYKIIAASEIPITDTEEDLKELLNDDDAVIFAMRGIHGVLVLHKHKCFSSYFDFCKRYMVVETFPSRPKSIIKQINFDRP